METTEITKNWRDVIKAAFPHTVPVLTGYLVLGMTYGILMQARGYGPLWSTLVSIITYGGSAQYAAIVMFAGLFDPVATFILSLTVNARYLFCSVGMLNKFADTGRYRPFLFFSLSDESFAVGATTEPPAGMDRGRFFFSVFFMDYLYWIIGTFLGGALGSLITFDTTGLDFALTAMYVTMFIDLMRTRRERICGIIGAACALASLLIFGSENVVIPALILILIILIPGRRKLS